MWPSSSSSSSSARHNYGLTSDMNNMVSGVGLRDLFVVAPPQNHHQDSSTIRFDPLHSIGNNYATATTQGGSVEGVNLIPLLSTTPSHPQPRVFDIESNVASGDAQNCTAVVANLLKCGTIGGGEVGGVPMGVCLDCGNQSKKDCSHGRCRTCCKSRGYDCTTHVKSTWIPAASRRRDKHSTSSSSSKKPKLITNCQTGTASDHTSTSNTTTPRSFDSSTQDPSLKESLPEQIQAAAKFKCMRFTSVEDGEDEYAYEALVKIGGHIFKGVLYDKGLAHPKDGIPNIGELHLGGYSGGIAK